MIVRSVLLLFMYYYVIVVWWVDIPFSCWYLLYWYYLLYLRTYDFVVGHIIYFIISNTTLVRSSVTRLGLFRAALFGALPSFVDFQYHF